MDKHRIASLEKKFGKGAPGFSVEPSLGALPNRQGKPIVSPDHFPRRITSYNFVFGFLVSSQQWNGYIPMETNMALFIQKIKKNTIQSEMPWCLSINVRCILEQEVSINLDFDYLSFVILITAKKSRIDLIFVWKN